MALKAAQQLLQLLPPATPETSGTSHNESGEDPAYGDLGVAVVDHHGIRTRALLARKGFHAGDTILTLPPNHVLRASGTDREFCRSDACRLGLQLAEARAKGGGDPFWQKAIEAYPSLKELEALGVPLVASEKALALLAQAPEFQPMAAKIRQSRGEMLAAVGAYNRAKVHPHLTFADALWGRAVVETSNFGNCGWQLAPVADWVNHSAANVQVSCDTDGNVKVIAEKDIPSGGELTASYNKLGPVGNFSRYGIIQERQDGGAAPLSSGSCMRLQLASMDNEPVLRAARKFLGLHCAAPGPPPSPNAAAPAPAPAPKAAAPEPRAAPAPREPTADLQWGTIQQIQPMTQIPGISNLLYGPRPYVPVAATAWNTVMPVMATLPPLPWIPTSPPEAPRRSRRGREFLS
ncbi:unnamed protein product [Effrenium voratum]|uniref:SET domain-containing protein n=1 Tax=Effrenium voratum TaxID=2562239 RepID=A0AA36N2G5_9DINO|nr:unnamed protein product [Effrenium voratum]CAJ1447694.1 unnamed protein product [Effrenium voratum]